MKTVNKILYSEGNEDNITKKKPDGQINKTIFPLMKT